MSRIMKLIIKFLILNKIILSPLSLSILEPLYNHDNTLKFTATKTFIASHRTICEKRAARGPGRNQLLYTGLNLKSTGPPLIWTPSHIEKRETRIFLWKPHAESARFEPGTNAWLVRQSGALSIAPRPLLSKYRTMTPADCNLRAT